MVTKAAVAPVVDPTPTPVPVPDPTPVVIPPLPSWTDAAAISSYITTILGGVFAVYIYLTGHGEPVVVQAVVPSVSVIIAGVAQLVNIIMHRNAQIAAIRSASWY